MALPKIDKNKPLSVLHEELTSRESMPTVCDEQTEIEVVRNIFVS